MIGDDDEAKPFEDESCKPRVAGLCAVCRDFLRYRINASKSAVFGRSEFVFLQLPVYLNLKLLSAAAELVS